MTDSSVLLGGMIMLFVGTFVWLTWHLRLADLAHQRQVRTFGFDLGIFDQGVWLLSRFGDPFVTIRGLPLSGDHASHILVLVAPLYWLWADPRLLLLQVVWLAIPAAGWWSRRARARSVASDQDGSGGRPGGCAHRRRRLVSDLPSAC